MLFIYNLGLVVFNVGIRIASLFNKKARKLLRGRQETLLRLKNLQLQVGAIWVHCSSLGEFEQGRPMIEAIKEKDPDQKIVLTFFSPSGYEVQKNYELADYVFYLPADRKQHVKKFVTAINPKVVIFVKYEFWYHFLKYLNGQEIPTYIVSAIFRPQHAFFKWYGGWYQKMLHLYTKLYVQDEESAALLKSIGIDNCQITGDTRFDRVYEIAQKAKEYPVLEEFSKGVKVLVGGSTWPAGEKLIAEYLKENTEVKVLLAPHEIHETHIKQIEELLSVRSIRYTLISNEDDLNQYRVIVVDTMGMLSSMYRYGDVAYIGGGFGSGIHNTLEASTFGLPVIFGPNYKKYKEACDLEIIKGGFPVQTQKEFNEIADSLLLDEYVLQKASGASKRYVDKMRGATSIIVSEIF